MSSRLLPALLSAALAAAALAAAPSSAAATEIGGEWHLIGLEGQPAPARLSITFTTSGRFHGQAPCNRYFGTLRGELPAISLGAIGATKMACPDMAVEAVYLEALQAMTSAEVAEGHLFLIGPEGRVMEFVRRLEDDTTCLSCLALQ